jgi:hypothetical protein
MRHVRDEELQEELKGDEHPLEADEDPQSTRCSISIQYTHGEAHETCIRDDGHEGDDLEDGHPGADILRT